MSIEKIRKFRKIIIFILSASVLLFLGLLLWPGDILGEGEKFRLLNTPSTEEESGSASASGPAVAVETGKFEASSSASDKDQEQAAQKITVCMSGEVKNPGVYILPAEAILNDAVKMAGGFTDFALTKKLNLASKLSDNALIYILSESEENNGNLPYYYENSDYRYQNGEVKPEMTNREPGQGINAEENSESNKISINKAGKSELTRLPGIGEKTADAIISYRNENGEFGSIEDLMKVPGIKKGRFSEIQDLICP